MRFKTIEHTADVGIEVEADSLEELFAGAAEAMFCLMVDTRGVRRTVERVVRLEASDLDELMFRWLNELIFFVSAESLVFSGFDVGLVRADGLEAVVSGEPIDQSRHELKIEVKAATYHELKVEERDGAWAARVIFDV